MSTPVCLFGRRCSNGVIESTGRLYSFVVSRRVVVLVDLSISRHALVFLYFHQGQETMKSPSDYEHISTRNGFAVAMDTSDIAH